MPDGRASFEANPLLHAERALGRMVSAFHRPDEQAVWARCVGLWSDYRLTARWTPEVRRITITCCFAVSPPAERVSAIRRLHAILAPGLGSGDLTLDLDHDQASFAMTMELGRSDDDDADQIERGIRIALQTCELFFPVFHLVAWTEAAIESALNALFPAAIGRA